MLFGLSWVDKEKVERRPRRVSVLIVKEIVSTGYVREYKCLPSLRACSGLGDSAKNRCPTAAADSAAGETAADHSFSVCCALKQIDTTTVLSTIRDQLFFRGPCSF